MKHFEYFCSHCPHNKPEDKALVGYPCIGRETWSLRETEHPGQVRHLVSDRTTT